MDSNTRVIKSILSTLYKNREYLIALNILIQAKVDGAYLTNNDLKLAKEQLISMHQNPVQARILDEAFTTMLNNPDLLERFDLNKSFIRKSKQITKKITSQDYFDSEVLDELIEQSKPPIPEVWFN